MKPFSFFRTVLFALCTVAVPAFAANNPFLDNWELTIPGGGAGWLGVTESNGELKANLLWGGGSVEPVHSAKVEDGKLILTRIHRTQRKDATGKEIRTNFTETITAIVDGDALKL